MDGNWIGLGFRGSKPSEKRVWGSEYQNPDIEKGELEILKRKCIEGDKEACAELEKIEKDNEDFLEHLMAIADYDEYPPKLKEPKKN